MGAAVKLEAEAREREALAMGRLRKVMEVRLCVVDVGILELLCDTSAGVVTGKGEVRQSIVNVMLSRRIHLRHRNSMPATRYSFFGNGCTAYEALLSCHGSLSFSSYDLVCLSVCPSIDLLVSIFVCCLLVCLSLCICLSPHFCVS